MNHSVALPQARSFGREWNNCAWASIDGYKGFFLSRKVANLAKEQTAD